MNFSALFWMFVLLIANGFFVAAEFAFTAARKEVIEKVGSRRRQGGSRGDERVVRHTGRCSGRNHPGDAASRFRGRTFGGTFARDSLRMAAYLHFHPSHDRPRDSHSHRCVSCTW